jgi:hypothetical protein
MANNASVREADNNVFKQVNSHELAYYNTTASRCDPSCGTTIWQHSQFQVSYEFWNQAPFPEQQTEP